MRRTATYPLLCFERIPLAVGIAAWLLKRHTPLGILRTRFTTLKKVVERRAIEDEQGGRMMILGDTKISF